MKPPKPPVPPYTAAESLAERMRGKIAGYQRRIRDAIFKISEKVPSDMRPRLDSYLRQCKPELKFRGDADLPDSVRRHSRDSDRTTVLVYPGILYFHCGNAVLTFYEYCQGQPLAEALERRIALLEKLAKYGPRKFDVIGCDPRGYEMIHKDDVPISFLAPGGRNDEKNTEKM